MELLKENMTNSNLHYFLQQGQSIVYLHKLLFKNASLRYIGKWASILIELFLYVLSIAVFAAMVILPDHFFSTIVISNSNYQIASNTTDNYSVGWIWFVKIIIALFPLLTIALARLLKRHRQEKDLIHKAFEIAQTMRDRFVEMKDEG
jgi:hypothetical protein